MSFGFFQIQGVQSGVAAGGGSQLGPYSIPFGSVFQAQQVVVNTTATVAVPLEADGVFVIPPIGNTTPSLEWSTVSTGNAVGNFIAPGGPAYWPFDEANHPSNLYLVSGGNVSVQVQFV